MLRILSITVALLASLGLLVWLAFRIWLVQQPMELRASIESFDTLEFLEVVYDTAFPSPGADLGGAGRRVYPGRGHSPWVLRTALDGRPRMLSIALAPDHWLAYSTETAGLHQLWRGDIDLTGPVYDHRHGNEPRSRGVAFGPPQTGRVWQVEREDVADTARVRWQGHGFDPLNGALWLAFELAGPVTGSRRVEEWPELRTPERDGGALRLERRFVLSPGPVVTLSLPPAPTGTRRLDGATDNDVRLERDERTLRFAVTTALEVTLVDELGTPSFAIDPGPERPIDGDDPFAGLECPICHQTRERVTGPAWSEIALRYAGTNREATLDQLTTRVLEGGSGRWGSVSMPSYPDLDRRSARRLVAWILDVPPAGAPVVTASSEGVSGDWVFGFPTEPAPEALHPALTTTPIDPPGFTPRVGGLAWLPDGRLGVATWDRDGAVFAVDGWHEAGGEARVERMAEGLQEPLGLAVLDDAIYVLQKQELTRLVDVDGDGWTDTYRTIANDWSATSNFHEFAFGLVPQNGQLYGSLAVCVLVGGKSCRHQTPDRGKVFRVDPESGTVEFLASGFRTPNGLASTPDGALLVTDNQGDWLPASKLIRLEPGAFYGWRGPEATEVPEAIAPPALWLPQNEIGNSPTQPLVLTHGPYAGQVLWGDVFNGGLKRGVLEEVEGVLQGVAFHFSGGLEGPVNRLLAGPDGVIVAGQVGSRGNWGERGKREYGLELLRFTEESAFEPLRVSATHEGFEIQLTRPIAAESALSPEDFSVSQWSYRPGPVYGGPKVDLETLAVERVHLSADRRVIGLRIPGLAAGRVVYLKLDRSIRSDRGEPLWVNEAWYTSNRRPRADVAASPPNTLTDSERAEGWRLLFDGESFDGWKIYGAEGDAIEGWVIEDGALRFTRDVSFAGLVWNHLNPFATAALDLMTKERFVDFELTLEWKISPGGNSGIFYAIPDETSSLSWDYGLEMQVLDDAEHPDGQRDRRRAGDLYDLQSLERGAARTAGEWNRASIRVEGERIQHFLNGRPIVDLVRGSPEWDRALAASKFAGTPGFGRAREGHIALQDHGDVVWYRDIKIRPLTPSSDPPTREIPARPDSSARPALNARD